MLLQGDESLGVGVQPTPVARALLRRWRSARRTSRAGLKVRVHRALKEAILARELVPGDVISEREIERIFHVSRVPVREALKVLEAEGWVATQPRRGTRVLGLDRRDVDEIFQLREHLEPLAARLAVTGMTPADDAWFRRTLEAMARSLRRGALDSFVKRDLAVHTRIARLSGNARLEAIVVGFSQDIRRLGTASIAVRERQQFSLREHENLCRALWARDGRAAARCMLAHVVNTRRTILRLLARAARRTSSGGSDRWSHSRPLRHRRVSRHSGERGGSV